MSTRDPAAVIREHAGFVWRVLRHLGVIEAQLDELSQQVFLIVLRQLPAFEGRSSLRTWIFGICRNVAQRARRQSAVLRELPTAEPPEHGAPATQEHALWLKQAYAHLLAALQKLSDDQRTVFVLYEIEGLPMEEIAELLEVPLTTAYSRLSAARDRIESELRRKHLNTQFRASKGSVR